MKTLKLKQAALGMVSLAVITAGTMGFVSAKTHGGEKEKAKVKSSSTTSYAGFKREQKEINGSLERINSDQARLKSLRQQCKDERAAGVHSPATTAMIAKAKADIRKERAYLRADKKELIGEHQALINERRADVREERMALRDKKRKLNEDVAMGSYAAVQDAQQVIDLKQSVQQRQGALSQAMINRNKDVNVINAELMDYRGAKAEMLQPETSKREGVAMK